MDDKIKEKQVKRHVILDVGVFRDLTKKTNNEKLIKKIVDEINARLPLVVLGLPGLLPKYLGLNRPPYCYDTNYIKTKFDNIDILNLDKTNEEIIYLYKNLITYYQDRTSKLIPSIEELIKKQLCIYTNSNLDLYYLAHDILYTKGSKINEETRFKEIAVHYALDEMFYHGSEVMFYKNYVRWSYFFGLLNTSTEYRHYSYYRLFESILNVLKKVHKNSPQYKVYVEIEKGLSKLTPDEHDDALWLWQAFQGNFSNNNIVPVTVFTRDKKGANRIHAFIKLLNEKYKDETILNILKSKYEIVPGEIIVVDSDSNTLSLPIDVSSLLKHEPHFPIPIPQNI